MWLKKEGHDQNNHYKLFFKGRLTKCRHCPLKHQCMRNPASPNTRTGHGRQVSFILATKRKLIYSHRMSVVEPVFGNIGANKGQDRFSLRGKKKVRCQWELYCIVHNIEKLMNYGTMAA